MRTLPILILLAATPALAQPLPGDPEKGLKIAQAQCVECHHVEREWADLTVRFAPDFIDIAETKGINERSLRVFFKTPHRTMPNIILTPDETDDIISYFLSLQQPVD